MRKSMYEQLYDKLASDIRAGVLEAGYRLPSVRKYAEENGISRNTVLGAYSLLMSEGYIYSREKSGYYVSRFEQSPGAVPGKIPQPVPEKSPVQEDSRKQPENPPKVEELLDLSANLVDSSLFPYSTLRSLYREALSGENIAILEQAGSFQGDEDLRRSIAHYVYSHKQIQCSPEQIVIGNGSTSHLQSLGKLFGRDALFLMESPGFAGTNEAIRDMGNPIIQIPLDSEGASVKAVRKASEEKQEGEGQETRILHISPSHQFPMGITMTAPRRTAILNWAAEGQKRYIIEDDYDSDFRYNGHPIASLMSMDSTQSVIYIGTFSRTLTPSMRISYMILPKPLIQRYRTLFSSYPCPVSRIDQKAVSLFMDNGHFERHISRMRRIYKARRNTMLEIFQTGRPDVAIQGQEAGLHFIARFPEGEDAVASMARSHGIIIPCTGTGWSVIGYAHLTEEEMRKFGIFLEATID